MSRYHIFISSGMVNLQCTVLMQLTVGIYGATIILLQCTVLMQLTVGIYGATIILLDGTNVHMVCVCVCVCVCVHMPNYIY
jgi:hypothetical protein